MSELNKLLIVSLVSRKLTTYSSPVTSHLGQNVGLGEGRWSVSIQKPKLICLVSFFHGVSRTAENWIVGKKIPFHCFSRHFLFKRTVGLFDSSQKPLIINRSLNFFMIRLSFRNCISRVFSCDDLLCSAFIFLFHGSNI